MSLLENNVYNKSQIDYFNEGWFKLDDPRTWPFYPIVMPLTKEGYGPASEGEIFKICWQVWDCHCNLFGQFDYLPDAISHAMKMNKELLS